MSLILYLQEEFINPIGNHRAYLSIEQEKSENLPKLDLLIMNFILLKNYTMNMQKVAFLNPVI